MLHGRRQLAADRLKLIDRRRLRGECSNLQISSDLQHIAAENAIYSLAKQNLRLRRTITFGGCFSRDGQAYVGYRRRRSGALFYSLDLITGLGREWLPLSER